MTIHPLVAAAAVRLLEVDPAQVAERVAATLVSRIEVVAAAIRQHPRLAADMDQARHLSGTWESESTVWLGIWLGRFEEARGVFALARAAEERALEVGRRVLGEEHPASIFALNTLAGTLQAQGDLAAARPLQEHALSVVRTYLDEEDATTLSFLDNPCPTHPCHQIYAARRQRSPPPATLSVFGLRGRARRARELP